MTNIRTRNTFDWMPENVKDLFNFLPVLGRLLLMAVVGLITTAVLVAVDFLIHHS
jgi:hypothetical protein